MHSNTEGSIGGLLGNFTQLSGDNEKNFDGSSTCVNLPTKIVDADTQEITVSNEVRNVLVSDPKCFLRPFSSYLLWILAVICMSAGRENLFC